MKASLTRKTAYIVAVFSIGIPILLMFWSAKVAAPLLLLGTYAAYSLIRLAGANESRWRYEEAEAQRLERQQSERGRTILVQLVDDNGNSLPAEVERKLIAAAVSRANPRDTVMGVHYVLPRE